ncbi:MAG: tetratricopeptide (TPR) repeat protein [Pirellulaceae bacterium]|jgi:tetratricopeptide (TPR) repeat protein
MAKPINRTASTLVLALVAVCSGCQWTATGHNLHGVRLHNAGQYSSAIQEFQKAIAKRPNDTDGLYNMAATLHRMGAEPKNAAKLEQAEALYHQCLDLEPNHVECHRGLAVLLVETGRSDKAFTFLHNWVRANPNISDGHIELARLYEEFGDKEAAEQSLHNALGVNENSYRAWTALGSIREQNGQIALAIQNYQRSVQHNNFQPQVAQRIATLSRDMQSQTSATNNRTRMVNIPTTIQQR